MARFELSRAARSDLQAIADYTAAHWGSGRALAYLDGLEHRFGELARRPSSGPPREELGEGVRSARFHSHVIFYVRAAFGITVVRVLHGRQDPERHLFRGPRPLA